MPNCDVNGGVVFKYIMGWDMKVLLLHRKCIHSLRRGDWQIYINSSQET